VKRAPDPEDLAARGEQNELGVGQRDSANLLMRMAL